MVTRESEMAELKWRLGVPLQRSCFAILLQPAGPPRNVAATQDTSEQRDLGVSVDIPEGGGEG